MRHIVCECPMFAQRENKRGHDWVDRKIHWEVFRKIDFDVNKNRNEVSCVGIFGLACSKYLCLNLFFSFQLFHADGRL